MACSQAEEDATDPSNTLSSITEEDKSGWQSSSRNLRHTFGVRFLISSCTAFRAYSLAFSGGL